MGTTSQRQAYWQGFLSGLAAIWDGWCSIFGAKGWEPPRVRRRARKRQPTVEEALRGDLEKIGRDMWKVIDREAGR